MRTGRPTGAARLGAMVFRTLAALALAVFILTPQGFMVSSASAGETLGGVPLVLCTGHGPEALGSPEAPGSHEAPGAPDHGSTGAVHALCAFAGHGFADTASPPAVLIGSERIVHVQTPDVALPRQPVLSLAAPPPPSQAPPATL